MEFRYITSLMTGKYTVLFLVSHVRRSHKQTKMPKRVQMYSETRFNSAYHMVQVFLDVFDELDLVLDSIDFNEYLLLDKEFF